MVAAGEIPPDATPSPLSVSVATLGGDSAPFHSREVAGAGAGRSRCCPQPGMLGLGAIMKHPDGISGLGGGKARSEVPRGCPGSHRVRLVGKLLHSRCELSPGLGQDFSLAEGSLGLPGPPGPPVCLTHSALKSPLTKAKGSWRWGGQDGEVRELRSVLRGCAGR